ELCPPARCRPEEVDRRPAQSGQGLGGDSGQQTGSASAQRLLRQGIGDRLHLPAQFRGRAVSSDRPEPGSGSAGGAAAPLSSIPGWLAALAERLLAAITSGASAIGTVWIVALMLLINADVIGRWLFR